MQDTKRIWVWIGVAVIVIGVIVFVIWRPTAKAPVVAVHTNPPPVYAPQGQLTPQFPKELILDGMTNVTSSYSIGYSSTTNQYTAVFNASTSMAVLFSAYTNYFNSNGWNITNLATQNPSLRGLYAENATSGVAVTIIPEGKGAQVTISLATK